MKKTIFTQDKESEIKLKELKNVVIKIKKLENVNIIDFTSFSCFLLKEKVVFSTNNIQIIKQAIHIERACGIESLTLTYQVQISQV